MADGGKVIIKIDGDDSGFRKTSSGLGNFAKGAFKAVGAGVVAATGAVVALGTAAVKSYSEYEQLKGGVETLFKDSAGALMNYANNAYKTAGMSANDYMSNVTSFSAAMIQSLGGDTAAAVELSNKALTDMSDNANKMGTDLNSIVETYKSLSRGNTAMLDNLKLGYGGSKKELERLIKDAEAYEKSMGRIVKYDATKFSDIVKAIGSIQEKLDITGTTAKEASTTIQGSAMAMKASWQNLLTGIADPTQDLSGLIDNLISTTGTFADNLLPVIGNTMSGISTAILDAVPELISEIPCAIQSIIPDMADGVGGIIDAMIATFTDSDTRVGDTVSEMFTTAVDAAGEIGGLLVDTLGAAIDMVAPLLPLLSDGITATTGTLQYMIPVILAATGAFGGYKAAVGIANTATGLFSGAVSALSNPVGMVGAAIGLTTTAVLGIKSSMENARHEFLNMGDELDVLSEKYIAAKENAQITDSYSSEWQNLNAAIAAGTLSADELAAAEARRKEIEQWFIDNYGDYISAEEQKNGIRDKSIEKIDAMAAGMSEAQRIELENQVLATKREMPDLIKEANDLARKNKELSTQNETLNKTNNTILKATSAWNALSDEQKASGKYQDVYQKALDDVNEALGTTYVDMTQLNGVLIQNNKDIDSNKIKIEENSKELNDATASIESFANAGRKLIEIGLGDTYEGFQNKIDLVKKAQDELNDTGGITQETFDALVDVFPDMEDGLGDAETASDTLEGKMLELQQQFQDAKGKAEEFGLSLDGLPKDITIDVKLNLPPVPHLARGTRGARKGPAVVNDGNGPELIQSRDGTCRIIDSPGSVLTWLDDGDRVYTAEQTRIMMRHVPHYANGVGNDGFKASGVRITKYLDDLPKAFEEAYDNLQLQRDMDVISESQYYSELASLRDRYLEQGSDKWWDYTEEIHRYEKDLAEERQREAEKAAEEERRRQEEARDKEFNDLSKLLERQFITQDEYYDRLGKLRDKHFEKGTSEWQEYTDMIGDYHLSKLREMTDSAVQAIEKLSEEQDAFRTKLEGNFALLEQDEKGMYRLADLSAHSEGMKEYYNNLKKLEEIAPESLYKKIEQMSTQEGGSFMYTFFAASEKEQKKFIDDYKSVYGEAAEITGEVFSDEIGEIQKQITEEFSKTPEEFFRLGSDSVEQFGSGFIEGLSRIMNNMRRGLNGLLEGLVPNVAYAGGNSNVYTDNSRITIIAGSKSEREIIEELENRKLYENQVRGW